MSKFWIVCLMLCSFGAVAAGSSKEAKVTELMNLMDMDALIDNMYVQMEPMLKNVSKQLDIQPSEQPLFDQYYNDVLTIMKTDFSWEKMQPGFMDIYLREFSEQEIDDLLAFYSTETGQAVLKKMPEVMQASVQLSQTLMQSAMPKIQARVKQLSDELAASRLAQ
ncbi:DUF2059 domain-containing protein [Gynuella sunshinyii]|uniref:DUF2059 domain-containing protein n=1 Tax=Gynuella sunshinyii YC6258 TaxID=1445510 RepID=A0A0C5VIM1_9GAMM|nr:DUF2059 domain-containing protein [Gynuella sunshinyii]AJQ93193.1 hypothetical protein YC6258_01144 [Gynuella sunshinyii YC6258]